MHCNTSSLKAIVGSYINPRYLFEHYNYLYAPITVDKCHVCALPNCEDQQESVKIQNENICDPLASQPGA